MSSRLKIRFSLICSATGKRSSSRRLPSSSTKTARGTSKRSLKRREKSEYAKKVGQLTMQVDWLKKKSEEMLGPDYESKFSPKPFQ